MIYGELTTPNLSQYSRLDLPGIVFQCVFVWSNGRKHERSLMSWFRSRTEFDRDHESLTSILEASVKPTNSGLGYHVLVVLDC